MATRPGVWSASTALCHRVACGLSSPLCICSARPSLCADPRSALQWRSALTHALDVGDDDCGQRTAATAEAEAGAGRATSVRCASASCSEQRCASMLERREETIVGGMHCAGTLHCTPLYWRLRCARCSVPLSCSLVKPNRPLHFPSTLIRSASSTSLRRFLPNARGGSATLSFRSTRKNMAGEADGDGRLGQRERSSGCVCGGRMRRGEARGARPERDGAEQRRRRTDARDGQGRRRRWKQ